MTTISENAKISQAPPVDLNTNLKFGNFDPINLDLEETVNVVMLFDTSYSMNPHKDELNQEIKSLIEWMKDYHQAPKIFVSLGRFDSTIEVLTGFQNVGDVKIPSFNPTGDSTKLYDGCLEFLKNAIAQQQQALDAGILSKTIFFVITDGADNASKSSAADDVKKLIDFITKDEATAGTFVSALCGIGEPSTFEAAKDEMGIQKLFVIDPNLSDKDNKKKFKEVFGWLSASVTSASTNAGPLVNF